VGQTAFHRTIRIAVAPGEVRAAIADDFHHFRVTIRHRANIIEAATTETLRSPYTLCAAAGDRLRELVGLALAPSATAIFRQVEARLQCTHQFDLAAFAIAAAARGTSRRYDVIVPDLVDRRTRATVARDGVPVMAWDIAGGIIVAPPLFKGRSTGRGFTDWVAQSLDEDDAEAALVLRRAVFVSRGRRMMAEINARAHPFATSGCWVQQPDRAKLAYRDPTGVRDFSAEAEGPGVEDVDWLGLT
jgi:hypothetical protein